MPSRSDHVEALRPGDVTRYMSDVQMHDGFYFLQPRLFLSDFGDIKWIGVTNRCSLNVIDDVYTDEVTEQDKHEYQISSDKVEMTFILCTSQHPQWNHWKRLFQTKQTEIEERIVDESESSVKKIISDFFEEFLVFSF